MDLKLRFLSEVREPVTSELGGKGRSLALLSKHRFNVPRGFIVPSSVFETFIEKNGFQRTFQKIISEISESNLTAKSEELMRTILEGTIPSTISLRIRKGLDRLSVEYVALRSSAVSEDSTAVSFAGLHASFLNIPSRPELVLKYVKRCWASLFNERAMRYRFKKGLPYLEGMAVVVQDMIHATVAGTTFTVHPDAKANDLMVIEATWGLGETLVSGSITPDRYIINKIDWTIEDKIMGGKNIMSLPSKDGAKLVKTPSEKRRSFCLTDYMAISIARLCSEIEMVFGQPQDIEWCIDNRGVWVLQSRPITSLEVGK